MSSAMPFDYLQNLAARFQAGFSALPSARDNHVITWSGIGFRIGEQYCVTAMDDIAEVLTEPAATRLPGVKAWVRGVANVRGRLLPLVDLTAFLGVRAGLDQRQRRVLVIEKGDPADLDTGIGNGANDGAGVGVQLEQIGHRITADQQ